MRAVIVEVPAEIKRRLLPDYREGVRYFPCHLSAFAQVRKAAEEFGAGREVPEILRIRPLEWCIRNCPVEPMDKRLRDRLVRELCRNHRIESRRIDLKLMTSDD